MTVVPTEEQPSKTRPSSTYDRAVRWGIGLLILLPVVVAIVCLVGRPWHPTDDLAIIDLRSRDVWSVHTPLTGLYSRPGWNHPGPLMFWIVSAISAVALHVPWATRIAGPIIEAGGLVTLMLVTAKRGLRMLLAAGTVAALTYLGIGPYVFRQTWNVFVPLPLLLLFVFLVCIVAAGDFRLFIAMGIVGSIMVETHVGFALLVGTGFIWSLGWVLRDWRREHVVPERWRSTVLIASLFSVVVWIPPLIGVITNTPGNLRELIDYFAAGSQRSVGLHQGIGIMAAEFRFPPPWLGGADRLRVLTVDAVPSTAWLLLVPVALLILGGFAARRTRSRYDQRAVGFAGLLFVVGIFGIAHADEPLSYTFQWRIVIAAFVVVTSVWSIASAVSIPRSLRVSAVALVIVVIAWGSGVRAFSERAPAPNGLDHRDAQLGQLMGQLEQAGLPKQQLVLVRSYGTALPSLFDGVVDALDREGVDVRVDHNLARVFGPQRVSTAAKAKEVWYVSEQGWVRAALLRLPGAHIIASVSPLSPSDDEELLRLQAVIGRELRAAHRVDLSYDVDSSLIAFLSAHVVGVDPATAARVAQLDARVERSGGCQCSIIAVSGPGRLETPPSLPPPRV